MRTVRGADLVTSTCALTFWICATCSFTDLGSALLPTGTVFTAVDNTAATPIAGTFANLADGSTFTAGSNVFQADYQGGDGNDLTLTVVP